MEKPPAEVTTTTAEAEKRFASQRLSEQLALDLVEEWISTADELFLAL